MSRGLDRERRIATALERDGWVVGSRRHIGGAGDLLAVRHWRRIFTVRLIEVKSTRTPWSHFQPADRQAMLDLAEKIDSEPWLYWWPKGQGTWQEIHSDDWP